MSARKAGTPRLILAVVRLIPAVLLTWSLTSALMLLWDYTPSVGLLVGISSLWTILFTLAFTNRKTLLAGGIVLSLLIVVALFTGLPSAVSSLTEKPGPLLPILLALPVSLLVTALSRKRVLLPPLVILTVGCYLIPVILHMKPTLDSVLPGAVGLIVFTALSALFRWSSVSNTESESRLSLWILPAAALLTALAFFLIAPVAELPKNSWLAERFQYLTALLDDLTGTSDPRTGFSLVSTGMQPDENQLGGPAKPLNDAVLEITSSEPSLLLRGAIYRDYNGHVWYNSEAVNRYRLSDTGMLSEIFDLERPETYDLLLQDVTVSVSHLTDGTASLFVPFRVTSLKPAEAMSMVLYYNDRGEVFSTEDVIAGRSYTVTASLPETDLKVLAKWMDEHHEVSDLGYTRAMLDYRSVPTGLPSSLRQQVAEITAESGNDAEKVQAIAAWLSANTRYTLNPPIPSANTDFVAHFMDTKEGYCSYYASAVAILSRLAGVPARYVEGYHLPEDTKAGDTVILTQTESHAWAEVYLNGIGWIPVDVSAGDAHSSPKPTPTPTPTATPEPTPTPSVSPTPTPSAAPTPTPTPPPSAKLPSRPFPWKTVLLILAGLLIIAAAVLLPGILRSSAEKKACSTPAGAVLFHRKVILRLLGYLGLTPATGETLRQFADRVDAAVPLKISTARSVAEVLAKLSYSPAPEATAEDAAALLQYRQRLDRFVRTEKGSRFYFFRETLRIGK